MKRFDWIGAISDYVRNAELQQNTSVQPDAELRIPRWYVPKFKKQDPFLLISNLNKASACWTKCVYIYIYSILYSTSETNAGAKQNIIPGEMNRRQLLLGSSKHWRILPWANTRVAFQHGWRVRDMHASSNKCLTSSNKCHASSNIARILNWTVQSPRQSLETIECWHTDKNISIINPKPLTTLEVTIHRLCQKGHRCPRLVPRARANRGTGHGQVKPNEASYNAKHANQAKQRTVL